MVSAINPHFILIWKPHFFSCQNQSSFYPHLETSFFGCQNQSSFYPHLETSFFGCQNQSSFCPYLETYFFGCQNHLILTWKHHFFVVKIASGLIIIRKPPSFWRQNQTEVISHFQPCLFSVLFAKCVFLSPGCNWFLCAVSIQTSSENAEKISQRVCVDRANENCRKKLKHF